MFHHAFHSPGQPGREAADWRCTPITLNWLITATPAGVSTSPHRRLIDPVQELHTERVHQAQQQQHGRIQAQDLGLAAFVAACACNGSGPARWLLGCEIAWPHSPRVGGVARRIGARSKWAQRRHHHHYHQSTTTKWQASPSPPVPSRMYSLIRVATV